MHQFGQNTPGMAQGPQVLPPTRPEPPPIPCLLRNRENAKEGEHNRVATDSKQLLMDAANRRLIIQRKCTGTVKGSPVWKP